MPASPIVCAATGATRETAQLADGSPSLPRGWKRLGGACYSPEGFAARFATRCVRIPVASVVEGYDVEGWTVERSRAGWAAFRAAHRESARQAARAANRMITELARCDTAPLEDGPRGPRLPKLVEPAGVAALVRAAFPVLDSQSLYSILQKARAWYRECRFEVRVLCRVSLPSFRQDLPVPMPKAALRRVWVSDQHQPFVSLRVGGHRFTLRLSNRRYPGTNGGPSPVGRGFVRQIAMLEAALALGAGGLEAVGEFSVAEKRVPGAGQNGGSTRAMAGSNSAPTRYMVGIPVLVPIEVRGREGALVVRTQKDRLLSVLVEGRDSLWEVNEDGLRGAHAAHKCRLWRISDDNKMERRRPRAEQADLAGLRQRICDAHRRKMDDALDKVSRTVANLAVRQRVGVVKYDDSERGWCRDFPWFTLRSLVEQKVTAEGVSFEAVGCSDENDGAEVLDENATAGAD